MQELMTTSDEVLVVAGGASGIGKAVATTAMARGWKVLVGDRDEAAVRDLAASTRSGLLRTEVLDITDPDSIDAVTSKVEEELGPVTAIVNSAAVTTPSLPSWKIDEAEWERVVNVNLTGAWRFMSAFLPGMIDRGYGRVVQIASIAGKEGNALSSPYSASKGGLIALTKSVAKEVARTGVTVNAVAPTLVRTPMAEAHPSPDYIAGLLERIPLGRMAEPQEVADMVLFAASRACSFTTGFVFDVTGGRATY